MNCDDSRELLFSHTELSPLRCGSTHEDEPTLGSSDPSLLETFHSIQSSLSCTSEVHESMMNHDEQPSVFHPPSPTRVFARQWRVRCLNDWVIKASPEH